MRAEAERIKELAAHERESQRVDKFGAVEKLEYGFRAHVQYFDDEEKKMHILGPRRNEQSKAEDSEIDSAGQRAQAAVADLAGTVGVAPDWGKKL